jgi:hypothetical protein
MKRLCFCLVLIIPAPSVAADTPPQVAGTWAQIQVQTSIANIPFAGEVVSHTMAILRVVIEQDSRRLKVHSTPCHISVDSEIDMVRTVVPLAMVRAIGTQEFRARLKPSKAGWIYYQPPVMQTLGVRLTDEWKEEMPVSPDDPRLIDADADGKPGVTVRIEGVIDGAIYIAQRSWSRLEGIIASDRIKGSLTWQTDQAILDATSVLLSSSPQTRPSPVPSSNYFRAIRVAPEITCEDILKIPRDQFDF